jgi:hypothetical protein
VDTNRPFQFQKRGQLYIGAHNKTPSIIAVRVNNPDRSPLTVNGWNTAPTPTSFAEIVSGFPNTSRARYSAFFALRTATTTITAQHWAINGQIPGRRHVHLFLASVTREWTIWPDGGREPKSNSRFNKE